MFLNFDKNKQTKFRWILGLFWGIYIIVRQFTSDNSIEYNMAIIQFNDINKSVIGTIFDHTVSILVHCN